MFRLSRDGHGGVTQGLFALLSFSRISYADGWDSLACKFPSHAMLSSYVKSALSCTMYLVVILKGNKDTVLARLTNALCSTPASPHSALVCMSQYLVHHHSFSSTEPAGRGDCQAVADGVVAV